MSSPAGDTEVAGGHQGLPDLSLEGPFDVHQDRPVSGASPRVLNGMRGCQYRMTSYDQDSDGPDFSPAYGVQLHDPRLLEYWLHHLGHEKTLGAAFQLQHDAGLILSNVQVLQQLVTSFNRTSSEVMRVAFGWALFPADRWCLCIGFAARLTIWRPWDCSSQGVRGPLPSATCNACMSCSDCFLICFHVC